MENTNVLFDRKRLVRLIVPLIVEQVLAVTVGMADMVMVSGAGETAVSGISLVNTICVLLIVIFTSMASGGSVVGAQFLGSGDKKTACHAAEQLVMICGLIAQQEARRMKEENYEVVVFQGDPGTIDLTYEEIEAEWNKMLQTVPQIGKFRIIHQEKKRYTFEDYSSQIGNADAALGIWVHKGVINEKLFEAHPNLKYIATLGHGFEDFDVEMTRRRGLTITNTIYGDVTIAQYAMALLMNICHNVTVQSDYTKTARQPEPLTAEEKKEYLSHVTGVCLGSDAFFPFGDNIERARRSGVTAIVQPGGSIRDQQVIDTCNKYGIAMAFCGIRLFHH